MGWPSTRRQGLLHQVLDSAQPQVGFDGREPALDPSVASVLGSAVATKQIDLSSFSVAKLADSVNLTH